MSQHTPPPATSQATDLEAFCLTCPSVEDVTALLAPLNFRLVFSMAAQCGQDILPPLPAQYHYRDQYGTEVIYLAGSDSPLHTGELSLPPHASRFWLSRGGSDADTFWLMRSHLAMHWRFQWQEVGYRRDEDNGGDDIQEVA